MKRASIPIFFLPLCLATFTTAASTESYEQSYEKGHEHGYEITITNLTANNALSPSVIATHEKDFKVYEENKPSSEGLAELSQFGLAFATLMTEWQNTGKILEIDLARPVTGGPAVIIMPGTSSKITLKIDPTHQHVSMASMVAPTNDAFIAVNGIKGPSHVGETITLFLTAYDTGSEANTEICATDLNFDPTDPSTFPKDPLTFPLAKEQCIGTISGAPAIEAPAAQPEQPGFPAKPLLQPEGYVHVHRGIIGVGDLHPAIYNWNNPVAKVTIKRVFMIE